MNGDDLKILEKYDFLTSRQPNGEFHTTSQQFPGHIEKSFNPAESLENFKQVVLLKVKGAKNGS